jgi:LPXTG-motif cell wall-anchored protein
MKKFSLKALGATLLALGLVIAGVAAPAQAAATLTLSINSIATSTAIPAGMSAVISDAKFQNPNNNSQKLDKIVIGPTSGSGTWTPLQTCTGFANQVTPALCGIDSIKFNNVDVTSGWSAYYISPSIYLIKNNAGSGYTDGQSIEITFLSGAFTSPSSAVFASMKFETMYLGGATLDNLQSSLTVGSPTSTVTFNANGGTGTMANQVSGVSAALNTNTFTRAGYTFAGWNIMANGIGNAYADGATYNFLTSRTLYAQWTAGGGGGGSATSVNLTLNASTGQLVAGSSVAVVASGLQATAPYTVVVQSTPQTIGSGNAVSGAVNTSVTLPSGLEAGWHTLTFSSTAADGSAISSVTYFKVSSDGTLLATASTIPAELASTGIDAQPYLYGGLALAIVGSALLLIARRKQTN